jgi:hypothetical protein
MVSSPFLLSLCTCTHNDSAAFPSSEAFDAINSALAASDADRQDAVKQGNAVFAFTLKNKAGETESWHIDLKNKGEVGKGLGEKPTGTSPPHMVIADKLHWEEVLCRIICHNYQQANLYHLVTLSLSDEDFGKLVTGKANAQRLFMAGKLKVKGDVMKATKMEPILKKAQTPKAKL